MIYFLVLFFLLVIGLYWYIKNNVLLPSNINTLIEEVKSEPLEELVTGTEGIAKNGDLSINYEIIGKVESAKGHVILVSGLTQTMLVFPKHFYEPLVKAGYQVIRMDNRGLGKSSWVKNWTKETAYSLEDMATDVIAVADELEIKQFHIIGMSMGGMISQRVAISYSDRLKSLTSIMSTGFYHDPELVSLPTKFYRDMGLVNLLYAKNLHDITNKLKLHLAINNLLHGKGYQNDEKLILQKAYYEITRRNAHNPKAYDQHSRAILLSQSRYEELDQITVPTLVIHGKEDTLVKFEHAQKYAPMIKGVKTLFIEGMGHHLPKAHSKEISNSILSILKNAETRSKDNKAQQTEWT